MIAYASSQIQNVKVLHNFKFCKLTKYAYWLKPKRPGSLCSGYHKDNPGE